MASPKDREWFREMCSAYSLGALDPEDMSRFQEALQNADADDLAFFAQTVSLAEKLALSAPQASPPDAVKARIMGEISTKPMSAAAAPARGPFAVNAPKDLDGSAWSRLRDALGFGRARPWFAYAGVALAISLLIFSIRLHGRLDREETALHEERLRIVALEDSLERKQAFLDVLLSSKVRVADLQGEDPIPKGYGKVFWSPTRRVGILHVANMPPAPKGMVYQFWFLVDDKTDPCVNGGAFKIVKTGGDGDLFRIEGLAELDHLKLMGFLVTLEPNSGAPHPTGKTYLKSSILL